MNNENYDEYQIINRQKIAFQTLIITLALVLLNGAIANFYEWTSPLLQAIVILYFSIGYFITRAIFKNAYLSTKVKHSYISALCFFVVGILNTWVFFRSLSYFGYAALIRDGKLHDGANPLMLGVFFLYVSAIIIITILLDRRQNEEELC